MIFKQKNYQNIDDINGYSIKYGHIIDDKSGVHGEDKQLGMYFVSVDEINNLLKTFRENNA